MLRIFAVAIALVTALPTLVAAEERHEERGGRPPPGRPAGPPHGPPPGFHGPPGRPGGPQFTWRGHPYNRFHGPAFAYPAGWGYRRWAVGAALPALFLAPAYYWTNYAAFGLPPPEPGFQWVRYGPDLLLVNIATGQVVDVVYGAFY
jgi:Ni/Co efflux regulator RcnB